jgi:hypothetical protein
MLFSVSNALAIRAMEISSRDTNAQLGHVTGTFSVGSFMAFLSLRLLDRWAYVNMTLTFVRPQLSVLSDVRTRDLREFEFAGTLDGRNQGRLRLGAEI